MLTLMTGLLIFNGAALAGVLAMSRFSSQLVDDDGTPVDRNTAWLVRTVPMAVASVNASR